MKRILIAASAALSLGGCVSLLPEQPEAAYYRLEPPASFQGRAPETESVASKLDVAVGRPDTTRALAGSEIALAQPDGSVAYMADVRWVESVPELLQNYIITAFEMADAPVLATSPRDGVRSDFVLALDVRRFEARYDSSLEAAPVADVAFHARVVRLSDREVVAAQTFAAEVPASENRVSAIVQAFNAASADVMGQLVDWTAQAAAANPPPPEEEAGGGLFGG